MGSVCNQLISFQSLVDEINLFTNIVGQKIFQTNAELKDWLSEQNSTIIFIPTMGCLLYTSPSPRDRTRSRMPSSA